MSPKLVKSLLTLGSLVLSGAAQMPDLTGNSPIIAQVLVAAAGFLVGWAHMRQPTPAAPEAK